MYPVFGYCLRILDTITIHARVSPGTDTAHARHTDTQGAARLHKTGSRLAAVPNTTPRLSRDAQSHLMACSSEEPSSSSERQMHSGCRASEGQMHLLVGHLGLHAPTHASACRYLRARQYRAGGGRRGRRDLSRMSLRCGSRWRRRACTMHRQKSHHMCTRQTQSERTRAGQSAGWRAP